MISSIKDVGLVQTNIAILHRTLVHASLKQTLHFVFKQQQPEYSL